MKKFNTSFNGYDKTEVNNFVNEVTMRYSTLLDALKNKDEQINAANEKLQYYQKIENTLNKAILIAEDASTQIKRLAREESSNILENAKRNASRIVNEALLKAEKAEGEADDIRRKVEMYKRRLKALIEEQLHIIDDIDEINHL